MPHHKSSLLYPVLMGPLVKVGCLIILLSSCQPKDPKFQQYYVQGEQLYLRNCSNCHQKSGEGLGLLYPPINNSDFVDAHFEEVICLMKQGKDGELLVNGNSYNQPMPGNPLLTDLEVAEIATYIYNTWGRHQGLVDVLQTTTIINSCPQ